MATQTEVARHLSLTDRQLRRLQKLPGAPISNKRGQLDLDAWRDFYISYSQRMAAGLNADLKTYRVTLSVTREEARHLEAFLAEHGGWKAFLWTPPYAWRQIKVTCAAWSSRVRMLRVEFSAEFKQVVN